MSKRSLHHAHRMASLVKTWQLVVVCFVLASISVYSLRQNYAKMVTLRESLYQADEQRKSLDEIEAALQALRAHVTSHMNTSLRSGDLSIKEPPIQLSGLYTQAFEAEKARVSQANEPLYTEAQADCEKRFPIGLSGSGRIPCIEEYVSQRGEKARDIPREVYMFDFVSPRWSPDMAGISLALTAVMVVITILKFAIDRIIVAYLRHHA